MMGRILSFKSGTVKFDELEKQMRIFETAHDHCVLPGLFMVARIDGRNFTRLTREIHHFDAPFDERMRDYMVETTRYLLQCGSESCMDIPKAMKSHSFSIPAMILSGESCGS